MRNWTTDTAQKLRVNVLVADRFSNLCLANCIEPLRAANELTGFERYAWNIVSFDGQPVAASSRLVVHADYALRNAPEAELLYVVASYGVEELCAKENLALLSSAAKHVNLVAGFDTGPWLMAAAGLLNGQPATIHPDAFDAFSERFLDVDAEVSRRVVLEDRVTCAGAMAAYDFTLDMIGRHLGQSVQLDVEGLFVHELGDQATPRRLQTEGDELTRRAVALMRHNLERPLTLSVLATLLNCQEKTLQRRLSDHLGAPPGAVYRHIRLSAARGMLADTFLTVAEVSVRCGYENASALSRAFKTRFGLSPLSYRKQARNEKGR